MAESSNKQDVGFQLQKCLKILYRDTMSHLCINPADPDDTLPLNFLYTDLTLEEEPHYAIKESVPLESFTELFKPIGENANGFNDSYSPPRLPLRILIQGLAGVGKSSLMQKIVYDWAMGNNGELQVYQNLFILSLRKIQPEQSLASSIKEQLYKDSNINENKLTEYVQDDDNKAKILIILDGLDEFDENTSEEFANIINRETLRQVCVLITSRPWQAHHLAKSGHKIDRHARILGFNSENRNSFIRKFFSNLYPSELESELVAGREANLANEIQEKKLDELSSIPLLLEIICLLYEQKENIPRSLTEIYKAFIQWLFVKYLSKSKNKEQPTQANYEEVVIKLGKFSLENSLQPNPKTRFMQKEIVEIVDPLVFKVGLVSTDKIKAGLSANAYFQFLNKALEENIQARHVSHAFENNDKKPWEQLKAYMSDMYKIREKETLLMFCAGESQQLAKEVLVFLEQTLLEKANPLPVLIQTVTRIAMGELNCSSDLRFLTNTFGDLINEDVKEMLDIQAKCLSNMNGSVECMLNKLYVDIQSINKSVQSGALVYQSCCVFIQDDSTLGQIINLKIPVLYLRFLGSGSCGYEFRKKTVSLIEQICLANSYLFFYFDIGEKTNKATLTRLLTLLRKNKSVKYTFFCLHEIGLNHRQWKVLFSQLLDVPGLVGLKLETCRFNQHSLRFLGTVICENAQTFCRLDLRGSNGFKGNFHMLTEQITQLPPEGHLVLTDLDVNGCLSPADQDALETLITKSPDLKELDIGNCKCEISEVLLGLTYITKLIITRTRDTRDSPVGLDLHKLFANLANLQELLEELIPIQCLIDNSMLEKLDFERLPNLKRAYFNGNRLTQQEKKKLKGRGKNVYISV